MGQNMHVNMGVFAETVIFNILADLSQWITQQHGVCHIMHYFNNFLLLGFPGVNVCQTNLDTIVKSFKTLGVSLALKKVEGPSISLSFLSIESLILFTCNCISPKKLQLKNQGFDDCLTV